MKAINVVGYRGSGKTELVTRLAQALKARGRPVGIVKHCHARIKVSGRDDRFYRSGADFGLLSDRETMLFSRRRRELGRLMKDLRAGFVIVEGFKSAATMPRIVCGKSPRERRALARGLAVASLDAAALTVAKVRRLAALADKKSFHLAGLDCGDCGRRDCRALATAIVAGKARPSDCRHLDPEVEISIDGKVLSTNRFVARLIRKTVLGMIDSLKGATKHGRVRIELNR